MELHRHFIFSLKPCVLDTFGTLVLLFPETWGSYFSKEVGVDNLVHICHVILKSNMILMFVFTS